MSKKTIAQVTYLMLAYQGYTQEKNMLEFQRRRMKGGGPVRGATVR